MSFESNPDLSVDILSLSVDVPPTYSSSNNTPMILDTKPVSKGDILVKSDPFAFVLKGSLRGLHCDNCLRKKQGLQRCSGCACNYYCNRDCQKSSWDIHKKECSNLKRLKPKYPPDTARLIARVIFRLKNGGYEHQEKITDQRSRKFTDLMNHYEDIKVDTKRQEHFESLLVVLKSYIGEDDDFPSSSDLFGIYGRILVNSYTITDKDLNDVGIGIYLAASIFDHACVPNAFQSFIGPELIVRSLSDWPEFDLNKIKISYIEVLNTTEHRKEELKKEYYFTCKCDLCEDQMRKKVMFSINCGNPECSHPVYIDEEDETSAIELCSNCGFLEFEPDTKRKYIELVQLIKAKLEGKKHKDFIDVCKSLIEKQESLLHKFNIWRVKLFDAAFESAITASMWDSAVTYGYCNLDGLKFYYGANHPMYGTSLLKLAKLESYLFRLQEALGHLEAAEPILKVSHGETHPLYCDDLAPLLKQARQEIGMMKYNGFNFLKKDSVESNGVSIVS